MKTTLATSASLCLLCLTITGCGAADSHAADQTPAKANTVISTDHAEAGTGSGPQSASSIDLSSPFSQTLSCRAGVKPYFEPGTTDGWLISFDGDQLDIVGHNRRFGGRLSTSGHSLERIEAGDTARMQTRLGETGGQIWFERNTLGRVVGAGHTGLADGSAVDCASMATPTWLPAPASTPFSKSADALIWANAGPIALNCTSGSATEPGTSQPAHLQLLADAELRVSADATGTTLMHLAGATTAERSASFVHESPLAGGLRVWISRETADPDKRFEAKFRFDFKLLELRTESGINTMRCVPAPLDPAVN